MWLICFCYVRILGVFVKGLAMMKQYWKEICGLLILKAILLTGLWFVSFRDPPQLDDKTAGEHILR